MARPRGGKSPEVIRAYWRECKRRQKEREQIEAEKEGSN